MNPLLSDYQFLTDMSPILLAVILTWSLVWKGLALWKAARMKSKVWFVAILIINTIGILEILYFFLFSKIQNTKKDFKIKK